MFALVSHLKAVYCAKGKVKVFYEINMILSDLISGVTQEIDRYFNKVWGKREVISADRSIGSSEDGVSSFKTDNSCFRRKCTLETQAPFIPTVSLNTTMISMCGIKIVCIFRKVEMKHLCISITAETSHPLCINLCKDPS